MVLPKIFVGHSLNDDAFTERLVSHLRLPGAGVTHLSNYHWRKASAADRSE